MTTTGPRGMNCLTLIIFIIVHHDLMWGCRLFWLSYLSKGNLLQDTLVIINLATSKEKPNVPCNIRISSPKQGHEPGIFSSLGWPNFLYFLIRRTREIKLFYVRIPKLYQQINFPMRVCVDFADWSNRVL